MHPILSQALVAERVREWEDRAARYRLVRESRRARSQAAQVAAGSAGRRGGPRQPAPRPAAAVPLARASREPAAVASGQPTVEEDRQPAGGRAA
jgi:hypothetical protein